MVYKPGQVGNPKGKPKGMHRSSLLKIETIVRLQMMNLGYTDPQMAMHTGITIATLTRLKRTKEYQRVFSQYTSGVLAKIDDTVQDNYKIGRQILEDSVPIALQNLAMAAAQKLDKKLQIEASKEILDRHGMFGKVSRIGLPTQDQGGFADERDNKVANELVSALSAANGINKVTTIDSPPVTDVKQ